MFIHINKPIAFIQINDYHSKGIDVNTWTVNNDEIKDFLFEEGVKVIITNRDI